MIDDFCHDEPEIVTHESWRMKFYGMIKDGRKKRVSPLALKIFVSALATILAALQILSGFSNSGSSSKLTQLIQSPKMNFDAIQAINIPSFDPNRQKSEAESAELQSRSQRQGASIAPLQSIKLSSFTGIPTGSEVSASLSSGGSNGTVVAKVTEPLIIDGETLLPAKTILFGKGTSSDERLFIRFKKAILPDKSEQKILAQVYDGKDRMIGLKGKKVSEYAFKLATSSGLIFLSGLAEGLKSNDNVNIFGAQSKPSVRDAALNGVATATSEQGKQMLEAMKNEQGRIEVNAETPIVVIFGSDQTE